MTRFQTMRRCLLALALVAGGTRAVHAQSELPPPPSGARPLEWGNPQTAPNLPLMGPYRVIVIDPKLVADLQPDFQPFGISLRHLYELAGGKAVDANWPERCNTVARHNMTWSIHSLSELGPDAEHGKWLAETITQVVQPQSWHETAAGHKPAITYHPQGKVLVVYSTPEVQAEVSSFLAKLRLTLAHEKMVPPPPTALHLSTEKTITQAGYHLNLPSETTAHAGTRGWAVPYGQRNYTSPGSTHFHGTCAHGAAGYPVPSVAQPKHLFHFIIRYEGEGIVDSNVVELAKGYAKKDEDKDKEEKNAEKPEKKSTTADGSATVNAPTAASAPEKEQLKVKWRTDYNAARAEAREKKLPIFVLFCKEDCSMCVKMDKTTFQDALIVNMLNDKFVAVKIGQGSELVKAMNVEAYPTFLFADSDGKILTRRPHVGCKDATGFFHDLLEVLDQRHLPDLPVQDSGPPLPPPPSLSSGASPPSLAPPAPFTTATPSGAPLPAPFTASTPSKMK